MKTLLILVLMTMLGVDLTSQMRPASPEQYPLSRFKQSVTPKQLASILATPAVVVDTFKAAPMVVAAPAPAPVVSAPTSPNGDKAFIYQHESGNRTDAVNEIGACGLGQALPCSKMGCSLSDYTCQDNWFTQYCISRYGSWAKARAFWEVNHYW